MGTDPKPKSDSWRAVHGGLLLALLAASLALPELAHWPWYFLVPLLAYAAIVCLVAPLRHSVTWLRVGRLDSLTLSVTAALILLSSAALVLYYVLFHPDLQ